jgi:hypothetical protein
VHGQVDEDPAEPEGRQPEISENLECVAELVDRDEAEKRLQVEATLPSGYVASNFAYPRGDASRMSCPIPFQGSPPPAGINTMPGRISAASSLKNGSLYGPLPGQSAEIQLERSTHDRANQPGAPTARRGPARRRDCGKSRQVAGDAR